MVRMIFAGALFLAWCSSTHATECNSSSSEVLAVEDWSVDVSPDRNGLKTAKTHIELRNQTDKPIRMVDGSVQFLDALGGYISSISIQRDLVVQAGETASWGAEYAGAGLERIPNLRASEVAVVACVSSVLYDDGQREDFTPDPSEPDDSLAEALEAIIGGKTPN